MIDSAAYWTQSLIYTGTSKYYNTYGINILKIKTNEKI